MRTGEFELEILGTTLELSSYASRRRSERGHPLQWVEYRAMVRILAKNRDFDYEVIPRILSAQSSRAVRKLAKNGALACEYSPKGRVTRIRLTADAIARQDHPEARLAFSISRLRDYYPTTRRLAAAIGKSVGTISRWENQRSLPDDFRSTIERLVLLIEQAKEDQKEERRRRYTPVSKDR